MWRNTQKKQISHGKNNNNRLRLVIAIIFLLSGALLYKLFSVQIRQFDLYTALASSQHQIQSQLMPERGQIFLAERVNEQEKLYPLATNKDFAAVYVVPKDIAAPGELAEKLFEFFDRPRLAEEALAQASSSAEFVVASSTKNEIIRGYLTKLDKPGDPYEPLNNKVDEASLLGLYAFLLNSTTSPVQAADLKMKNGRVVHVQSEETEAIVPGLGFDLKKYRYYPENEIAAHILGFVSYSEEEGQGHYGLEEFFNEELFGKYGSVKSEKGGEGNIMIVNDRQYIKPEPGSDLVLTMDRNIEFAVCDKLKQAVKKHGAEGGSVIVMAPKTGAIIAMCSVPDFNPNKYKEVDDIKVYNNPATVYQYEPGSVFKTVTMSIAIDQGKVSPATTYYDQGQINIKGWPKPIKNSDFATHGPHGLVDMNAVLENSLNTGAIFAMRQVGPAVFSEYLENYGFGERTGIELGSESSGDIKNLLKNNIKEIDAATASFGQGIAVTPLQMIMPYQAIANRGLLMKPFIVKKILKSNGQVEEIYPQPLEQVVSEKTAATVGAMLVNVVENGHSKQAAIKGYYIGGKTGTAQVATAGGYSTDQYIHTFVGIAPIDEPAFVMLTKIDNPKDAQFAESTAVPLWRDIADFILKYYGTPATRK